ncbi:hypothetical protein [Bacillus sinesaloumensis]|uniref:hypothetical protein n=1 Tax=Litchfieldia sinesaloumensis TaxID=1926280 RepID=UPI00098879BF|nr:hypothetical protein [Bacillus sinesaloumensis]
MEYLIFGIISLLLIFPIVYFLPVGFTKRGKLLVLVSAFIIFIIGLAARAIMGVWQTGIVLILLAIGFTYILATRFERQIFEKNEDNQESEKKMIKFELEDDIEKEIRSSSKVIHGEDTQPIVETNQQDSSSLPEEIVEVNQVDTNPIDETLDEPIEMEELSEGNNTLDDELVHEEIMDEPEEKTSMDSSIDDLLKELEMELENKNDESNDDVINEPDVDQQQDNGPFELDEIAVIEDISHIEPEHDDIDFASLQVNNEDKGNDGNGSSDEDSTETIVEDSTEELNLNTHLDSAIEEEIQNELSNVDEIEEVDPLDSDISVFEEDELDEEEETTNEPELIRNDEIEIEEINSIESQPENESTNESFETDTLDEDTFNSDRIDIIDENELEERDQVNLDEPDVTKQLLFNTMVSQIRLYRKQLSRTEYEKVIIEHLHPQLSDHDYYTFVSLLIDHYIETKQYEELSTLISQNMDRFEKYPVILQEIKFLLKEYCKI